MSTTQQFTFTLEAADMYEAQQAFNEALAALQKRGPVAYRIKTLPSEEKNS